MNKKLNNFPSKVWQNIETHKQKSKQNRKHTFIEIELKTFGDVSAMQNEKRENAMQMAARFGQIQVLEYLFQTYSQMVNARNEQGQNVFHVAVSSQQMASVRTLLAMCSKNVVTDGAFPPLQFALHNGFWEIATLIIQKYPCCLTQSYSQNGKTLMHLAAFNGDTEQVC